MTRTHVFLLVGSAVFLAGCGPVRPNDTVTSNSSSAVATIPCEDDRCIAMAAARCAPATENASGTLSDTLGRRVRVDYAIGIQGSIGGNCAWYFKHLNAPGEADNYAHCTFSPSDDPSLFAGGIETYLSDALLLPERPGFCQYYSVPDVTHPSVSYDLENGGSAEDAATGFHVGVSSLVPGTSATVEVGSGTLTERATLVGGETHSLLGYDVTLSQFGEKNETPSSSTARFVPVASLTIKRRR